MIVSSFLTLGMAMFLICNATQAPPRVLGIVMQASGANLNKGIVSQGTTVYEGDRLSTGPKGTLSLRSSAGMLQVTEGTVLALRSQASGHGIEAELDSGTLVFSTTRAFGLEVVASEASIRTASDGETLAQVSIASKKELRVCAKRGSLEFSYRGETKRIEEGGTYRVILDPLDSDSRGRKPPAFPLVEPKLFEIIFIGEVTAITILARHEAIESPDRP